MISIAAAIIFASFAFLLGFLAGAWPEIYQDLKFHTTRIANILKSK